MNDSSKHRVQDATNTPYKAPVAFIKHPGSKDKIGRMLNRRNLWPAHTRFVDYFGGSAEMIFHRTPSAAVNEVYNDLDPDISNLFEF